MRKRKNNDLNTYANEAAAQGLTYGQKQARDYLAQVKVGPVPAGYRKQSNTVTK